MGCRAEAQGELKGRATNNSRYDMSDLILSNIASGYNLGKINNNFRAIQDKINDEILHLTGGNNIMQQGLDMNSNRLYNLPIPSSNREPLVYEQLAELANNDIGNATNIIYTDADGNVQQLDNFLDDLKGLFGVCKSVASMTGATITLVNGQTIAPTQAASIANTGMLIKTTEYHPGSGVGGAEYFLKTLAQHRADIGDAGWVPDGYGDHYLFGGNAYVAIIKIGNEIDIKNLGATPGQDISDIVEGFASSVPVVISDSYVSSAITRDKVSLIFAGGSINNTGAANSLFLNVKDLELSGHGVIGDTEPYLSNIYEVKTGNFLNRLVVTGNIKIHCGGVTSSAFWCDPGVTADSGPYVVFSDEVEITGFNRSGIELAMDADTDTASFNVSNIKVHSGNGRCIQFGNNIYRCRNVNISGCPRLGDVISAGSAEAKGVLVYGRNVVIDGNTVNRVRNEHTGGGEGIYVKSNFVSITNNTLVDAGSSSDGCICLKGASWFGGGYADEGEWSTVIGNKVVMTDGTLNAKGIGCHDSNVIIAMNQLLDLRPGRASLSYAQAISIGGSEAVSNVICDSNIVNGWAHFCGNFADARKGRSYLCDNIKIKNNIVTNLATGGYALVWDARCRVSTPCSFDSSNKKITITGGLSQNAEFSPMVYPIGSSIVVSGTSSNNGTYTVVSVGRFELTVAEAITNETATPTISREEVFGWEITGNTFQTNGTAIRSSAGNVHDITFDNNTYLGAAYAYRFDSGTIVDLHIGAGETYVNVSDIDYATPTPSGNFYRGVKLKSTDTGAGTLTLRAFEVDYVLNYT